MAGAAGGAEVEGGAGSTSEEMEEGAEGDTPNPPAFEEEPAEELSGGCSPPGLRPPLDGSSWLSERMSPTPALPFAHTPQSQGDMNAAFQRPL